MITCKTAISVLERSLMIVGVTLLVVFALATIHHEVYSRLALHKFYESHAAVVNGIIPAAAAKAPSTGNQKVDFTLWSDKRVQAYRESLLTSKESPVAVLRLAKFNLRVPVFEGTDELALNRGVGWIAGTAKPGQKGNVGIAGHRDGFFRPLKDIAAGDEIELFTTGAKAIYTVDQIEIVNPDNVGVLRPRRVPSLTLTTCYPFYFIGDAPQRFIVHAALKQQIEIGSIFTVPQQREPNNLTRR
jgi:sortase A